MIQFKGGVAPVSEEEHKAAFEETRKTIEL